MLGESFFYLYLISVLSVVDKAFFVRASHPIACPSWASPRRALACCSRPRSLSSSWSLACYERWHGPLRVLRESVAPRRGDPRALRELRRRRELLVHYDRHVAHRFTWCLLWVRVQHRVGQLPLVLGGHLDGHLLVPGAVGRKKVV